LLLDPWLTHNGCKITGWCYRHHVFEGFKGFSGSGQALGGREITTLRSLVRQEQEGMAMAAPMGKEEFLNRLPARVIKGGMVIDVRGAIEERLSAGDGKLAFK